VRDHGRDRGGALRRDVVCHRLQLREGPRRHRFGEDVDDPPARQSDRERVVVGDAVLLQLRPSAMHHLVGELVDRALDAAAGNGTAY